MIGSGGGGGAAAAGKLDHALKWGKVDHSATIAQRRQISLLHIV